VVITVQENERSSFLVFVRNALTILFMFSAVKLLFPDACCHTCVTVYFLSDVHD